MRVVVFGLLAAACCFGTLNHIYVDQRPDIEKAKDFGAAGPYERIIASVVYEPAVKIATAYLRPRDSAKGIRGDLTRFLKRRAESCSEFLPA